ncbi:NDP-hexose 2,3-dehydratase family protein [Streptomyces noursei]|uniref:NDP-hexose 2,3-dehydratase family protein n=1 Tax=Streptomyces noursei TaxID=1971 RepID=UPI0016753386|nr:NDP-hexose 2,3-dehydratase family protein [Streptomyces noursei]MCZ1019558.1 NDP-hexose 2,3-dehydratase family protein [Streptomyces noursei]GGX09472.1 NDP-hexose 2,3-dehydratase [Streptomyces noursei]
MSLTRRADADAARRLARSAEDLAGARTPTGEVAEWIAQRRATERHHVAPIPFDALDGWSFDPDSGDLGHRTGRFFTVQGVRVTGGPEPFPAWDQPVIRQPEVGILGLLVKEFGGVPHVLMQAKMEPGNPGLVQLSPTVQATRSNFTGAHRGAPVRYVEYFARPAPGSVLVDVLQSEHGAWFLHKANRNMIVETRDDVPEHEDFRWLTLGQIGELLGHDNLVNMDARSVLSCVPPTDDGAEALHSDTAVRSWLTAQRAAHLLRVDRIPLAEVRGWTRTDTAVSHDEGRFFRVVAVAVRAGNREVGSWTQPLFAPVGEGVTAFVTRRIGGVRHLLARAKVEGGLLQSVEIGPTVQCTPGNYAGLADGRPPFLDLVRGAPSARIRYAAVHSEEGGRFLRAESRYLLVEATAEEAPDEAPPGFLWTTPGQLADLTRHGNHVNVQARTLLACMRYAPWK